MRPRRRDEAVRPDPQNRRFEKRLEAEGEVLLSFDDPLHREVRAVLTDDSKSGFRAKHDYTNLETGQVIRFERPVASGRAKVVWNRISGGQVETGFLVL